MLTKNELLRIKYDIDESSENSELIWHREDIEKLFNHIEYLEKELDAWRRDNQY